MAGFAPFLFVRVQHGLDYTPQPDDNKVAALGRDNLREQSDTLNKNLHERDLPAHVFDRQVSSARKN